MTQNVNYWTWKDSEIIFQLEQYGVVLDKWDRKEAINTLKSKEIEAGVIKVAQVSPDGEVSTIEDMKKAEPKMETLNVIFHRTQDQDAPYVFIGLNGVCFYIKRDEEIEMPKYLIDGIIKDAVEDRVTPITDRDGTIRWITRKVQKYPYSLV